MEVDLVDLLSPGIGRFFSWLRLQSVRASVDLPKMKFKYFNDKIQKRKKTKSNKEIKKKIQNGKEKKGEKKPTTP